MGLAQITDRDALLPLVERVLEREHAHVAEYRAGKRKVFGYLVGQVMREAAGKADPMIVNDLLRARLGENQ
jgi:aspartyl-tRNA(Asn)/glutamyl-tRNA(Gln) amidotransferase subunit B